MKSIRSLVAFSAIILLCCGKQNNQQVNQIDVARIKKNNVMTDEKSFTSEIIVDQNPAIAFNAIKNFRGWWSEEIEGNTDQLNQEFFYHYKDIHLCKMKLSEMIPEKKVVYLVTENEFNFVEDKTEWVDTKLIFNLSQENGMTKIQFTHEGLVPTYTCYKVCEDAWTGYIQNSLYNYITTGKGSPNPKDGDGFNAELAAKWKLTSGV